MHEIGIDISGQSSKSVDRYTGIELEYVITVCDHAKELCPVFPGRTRHVHWSLDDPAAVEGSDDERLAAFPGCAINSHTRWRSSSRNTAAVPPPRQVRRPCRPTAARSGIQV